MPSHAARTRPCVRSGAGSQRGLQPANALRTIAVANAVMLAALAAILVRWMERPAGLVAGACCLVGAVVLVVISRRLDPYRSDPGWLDDAPE